MRLTFTLKQKKKVSDGGSCKKRSDYSPWPDSLRLIATDIDGELNGSFAEKDTILLPDISEEYVNFHVDLYMHSDSD